MTNGVIYNYRFLQVRHSQRCCETPVSCWIILEITGEVCCGHCTCTAGLGEVCTHIAAVLFYLETLSRINGSSVCTQQRCQWIISTFLKDIPYLPVADTDFTSAKTKKRLDEAFDETQDDPSTLQSIQTHCLLNRPWMRRMS